VLLAVVAGIAAGVVTAAMAVRSGWFRVDTGSLVGLVTGVLVVLCLVVAHRRTANDVPDDVEGHTDHTPATVGSG
jgi:xanthosine utilization system XapX-like protein